MGVRTVQQTAHWTAVIATLAVSVCLTIAMTGLVIVLVRDGNLGEVADAMRIMGQISMGLAIALGSLVGGPQIVSALVARYVPQAVNAPLSSALAAPPSPDPSPASQPFSQNRQNAQIPEVEGAT